MITISRTQNLADVAEMVQFFVVENDGDRAVLAQQLSEVLTKLPESVLIVQAKKDEQLVGFIIAHNTGPFVTCVQAWSRNANSFRIIDAMWSHVVLWTTVLGKSEIRAETRREIGPLHRRFGFVEIKKTIGYTVQPDLMTLI
jgi:hypothetical protein